jgi:3-keto-5-aminohexanoate cleavage enzyme
MASLNIASMNFGDDVFLNIPADVRALAKHMRERKVVPEVEVYDAGHIEIAKRLLKEGLLSHPIHYQFVLGVPGGLSGEPRNLQFMADSIDPEDTWAVAGIGRYELSCAVMAVAMGGSVRVGFEDNVFYHKGVLAESNAQLVERVARVAREMNRPVATPAEARKLLGLA